ncbi:MAG: NAD(P)-binding domain-containing protein [Gammaproteobacteria bacterium]|nr:NAD(P)-binding domain-containing protein [Gammaproteobacteria bacterium]
MSDVTVIGLGAMGSAIANAFLNAGHDVTVWNRGPEKTEPLRASGAQCADSPAEAVSASPGSSFVLTTMRQPGACSRNTSWVYVVRSSQTPRPFFLERVLAPVCG